MISEGFFDLFSDQITLPSSEANHIINIYAKEQKSPDDKGNLYLSGVHSLKPDFFIKHQINCVLSIIDKRGYEKCRIKQKVEKSKIQFTKWIDLQDMEDLSIFPYLDEAHTYIKSMLENHNVLVHCRMGMSRSASLVIAFLMKQYGMDYHTARIFTKNKRRIVQPNEGFEKDLLKFQQYLKDLHPNQFLSDSMQKS